MSGHRPSVENMLMRWGLVKRVREITGDETALPRAADLAVLGEAPGVSPTGGATLSGIALDAAEIDSEIRSCKAPLLERLLWDKYVLGWEEVDLKERIDLPQSGDVLEIDTGRTTYRFTFDIERWSKSLDSTEMAQVSRQFGIPNWYISDRSLRFFQWKLARSKGWTFFEKK